MPALLPSISTSPLPLIFCQPSTLRRRRGQRVYVPLRSELAYTGEHHWAQRCSSYASCQVTISLYSRPAKSRSGARGIRKNETWTTGANARE
ncbi:hypothetical protein EJ03DRAFT_328176 [Teratosphaeria nubilosa]|uniref:Uncharacterized protein n=1 Tax=Teratosphaeria nubilosa TaxID=161662 RepID=A0A6G1L6Q3_9PEZI|nr:hypothetical protein EJ03DRAFT_328176 [Teratosphaeria nubilosa]